MEVRPHEGCSVPGQPSNFYIYIHCIKFTNINTRYPYPIFNLKNAPFVINIACDIYYLLYLCVAKDIILTD